MSEIDLVPLQPALEKFIPLGRSGLLPALHAAQKIYGWLPESVAAEVAKSLRVPLADVHGVVEFYSLFYNEQIGRRVIRVCTDPACALKNADGILRHLCDGHGIEPNQTTPGRSLTIERSPCLGLCEHAPVALVNDEAETNISLTTDSKVSRLSAKRQETFDSATFELGRPRSIVGGSLRLLTANCGDGTTSLAKYGEYSAYKKVRAMTPEEVIAEIKASGLVGRGGAAFPTGVKWEGAAKADGSPKYIVCNADESEPGTFKDRVLLLDDPHRTIEGMRVAAYAIGATKGYIYLRGEYPYIVPVLENALAEARQAGYLNEDFDIEIRLGAGAYICGEETALFESIEGKRGFPRVKPPFPTTHGLFGKPTVINNVETLCNVPLIIEKGAAEYRKIGTEKSPGSKLFCVSGDVARPGLYEVPFGVTLRELLEMASGPSTAGLDSERLDPPLRAGATGNLQAVLFGGAAGAFTTSGHLDVKLTFEDLRAEGLPLGSGVVMVFDETRDLRDVLTRLGRFFAHESCGKCYPCQMGTQRQMEILDRVAKGGALPDDILRLQDVGWTMTDASLCGLGQTAASAVLSAIKLWPALFEARPKSQPFRFDQKEVEMSQTMPPEEEEKMPESQSPEPEPMQMPQPSMPEPREEVIQPQIQPMTPMMPVKPTPKPSKPKAKPKAAPRKPAKKAKPAKKKVAKKAKPKAAKKPARKKPVKTARPKIKAKKTASRKSKPKRK